MVKASVEMELGEEVQIDARMSQGSAIRFFSAQDEGKVKAICGVQEALEGRGVEEVVIYVKPGDEVKPLHSSNDRIGHVIAVGKNADEAWKNVEEAYAQIRVVLE